MTVPLLLALLGLGCVIGFGSSALEWFYEWRAERRRQKLDAMLETVRRNMPRIPLYVEHRPHSRLIPMHSLKAVDYAAFAEAADHLWRHSWAEDSDTDENMEAA